MQFKALFKKFISHGAVIYTCGSVLLMLISLLMSETDALKALDPRLFLYFALFSYIISLGSTIYMSELLNSPIRRLIHAICYNAGFFAFALMCGVKFAFAIIFTAIFAIIYTAISLIYALAHRPSKKAVNKTAAIKTLSHKAEKKPQKAEEKPYTNRFS